MYIGYCISHMQIRQFSMNKIFVNYLFCKLFYHATDCIDLFGIRLIAAKDFLEEKRGNMVEF